LLKLLVSALESPSQSPVLLLRAVELSSGLLKLELVLLVLLLCPCEIPSSITQESQQGQHTVEDASHGPSCCIGARRMTATVMAAIRDHTMVMRH